MARSLAALKIHSKLAGMTTVPKHGADRNVHSCGSEGTGREALSKLIPKDLADQTLSQWFYLFFPHLRPLWPFFSLSLAWDFCFILFCFKAKHCFTIQCTDTFFLTHFYWHFFPDAFSAAYLMSQRLLRHICLCEQPVHLSMPTAAAHWLSHLTHLKLPSTREDRCMWEHQSSPVLCKQLLTIWAKGSVTQVATLLFSVSMQLVIISLPRFYILESVPMQTIVLLNTRLWSCI